MSPTSKTSGRERARNRKSGSSRSARAEIGSVLLSEKKIAKRVAELAREIERDFAGKRLVVVALLNGAVVFLADLIRRLDLPMRLDFIGVSSYRSGSKSGHLYYTKQLRLDVAGQDVLVIDDILDSGKTAHRVIARLEALRPRSIKTCFFLVKQTSRAFPFEPDYFAFQIPDKFVVGYGLDYDERHRNLPFVAEMLPDKSGAV